MKKHRKSEKKKEKQIEASAVKTAEGYYTHWIEQESGATAGENSEEQQ